MSRALKKPSRLIALLMIMGLSLLVYTLAERQLRQALKQNNGTIPNQVGKLTQTLTMRRVFQMFEGVDLLFVMFAGQIIDRQVLNLRLVPNFEGPFPCSMCHLRPFFVHTH